MSESLEGRGKEAKKETLNQSSEAGAQVSHACQIANWGRGSKRLWSGRCRQEQYRPLSKYLMGEVGLLLVGRASS